MSLVDPNTYVLFGLEAFYWAGFFLVVSGWSRVCVSFTILLILCAVGQYSIGSTTREFVKYPLLVGYRSERAISNSVKPIGRGTWRKITKKGVAFRLARFGTVRYDIFPLV